MAIKRYNIFKRCVDGTTYHDMSELIDKWDEKAEMWDRYRICSNCGLEVSEGSPGFCYRSIDKKHKWEEISYVNNDGKAFNYKRCKLCDALHGFPLEMTLK